MLGADGSSALVQGEGWAARQSASASTGFGRSRSTSWRCGAMVAVDTTTGRRRPRPGDRRTRWASDFAGAGAAHCPQCSPGVEGAGHRLGHLSCPSRRAPLGVDRRASRSATGGGPVAHRGGTTLGSGWPVSPCDRAGPSHGRLCRPTPATRRASSRSFAARTDRLERGNGQHLVRLGDLGGVCQPGGRVPQSPSPDSLISGAARGRPRIPLCRPVSARVCRRPPPFCRSHARRRRRPTVTARVPHIRCRQAQRGATIVSSRSPDTTIRVSVAPSASSGRAPGRPAPRGRRIDTHRPEAGARRHDRIRHPRVIVVGVHQQGRRDPQRVDLARKPPAPSRRCRCRPGCAAS